MAAVNTLDSLAVCGTFTLLDKEMKLSKRHHSMTNLFRGQQVEMHCSMQVRTILDTRTRESRRKEGQGSAKVAQHL